MKGPIQPSGCGRCGRPASHYYRQPGPLSQRTDQRRFAACADPDHIAAAESAWAAHFKLDRKVPAITASETQGNLF